MAAARRSRRLQAGQAPAPIEMDLRRELLRRESPTGARRCCARGKDKSLAGAGATVGGFKLCWLALAGRDMVALLSAATAGESAALRRRMPLVPDVFLSNAARALWMFIPSATANRSNRLARGGSRLHHLDGSAERN